MVMMLCKSGGDTGLYSNYLRGRRVGTCTLLTTFRCNTRRYINSIKNNNYEGIRNMFPSFTSARDPTRQMGQLMCHQRHKMALSLVGG